MRACQYFFACVVLLVWVSCVGTPASTDTGGELPTFKVDPYWPKPLPDNGLIGQVSGVAVDSKDHIWLVHRPGSLAEDEVGASLTPPRSDCCFASPPVIELDAEGNVVQAWGGPGEGYDWPESEHGIFVEEDGDVWIGGSGANDHQILKFSSDGKFLLQIGRAGETGGSNDTKRLGKPADITVDPETNEVYVADGYGNRRIIVFDADTGEYKRHWGAYGKPPSDSPLDPYDPNAAPIESFRTPTHAVRISKDGLVYVGDRVNNRIQVFQKSGEFVEEVVIAKKTLGPGSCWDVEFSPDQRYLYVVDGTNQHIWILERKELRILGSFGRSGRNAGQFHWVHSLAVDSKGNLYTGEVETGKRAQKFVLQGPK